MLKQKKKKPLGIILWRGKSLFDNERIVVIATGVFDKSKNHKTGEMIQTYIIRADFPPMLARRMGEDYSICGNCKHRESSTCYINLCHGPINVYKAYQDGRYKEYEPEDEIHFVYRYMRIGSYGDPAAVPFEVWDYYCNIVEGFTGYTHHWKTCDQRLKRYCMASVDSIKGYMKEYNQAQELGWRTFRVRENEDNPLMENEFVCPASNEAGKLTTCEKCNCCSGLSKNMSKNPVIILHADSPELGMWRRDRYMKMMKKIKNKKGWRRDYKTERKRFKEVCPF